MSTEIIKTISTREVYRNPWTTVREDVIERSNGQRVLPRADQVLHELLGVRRLAQFELNENAFSQLIK